MGLSNNAYIPIEPRPVGSAVPLTASQWRLWNGLIDGVSTMRTGECSVRICGPLNTSLLRSSIDTVLRRHESLRTRIAFVDGTPRQQIDAPYECDLEVTTLKGSPIEADGTMKRLAEEFICEKIDLSVGPLFAAKLVRLSEYEHVLMLGIDHIVTDAASYGILMKELWTIYAQNEQRLPSALPNVPIQFADYAVWQQQTHEAWRKAHEHYWLSRMTGAQHLELPFDGRVSSQTSLTLTTVELPFGSVVGSGLRNIAYRERTLLPLVILTVVAAVISRWCNQKDFIITFISHGRHARPQLANTTGLIATPLYLRIEIAEGDSFLDLLKRAALELWTAHEHQGLDHVPDLFSESTSSVHFNWTASSWTRRSVVPTAEVDVQCFPIRKLGNSLRATWRKLGFLVLPGDTSESSAEIVIRVQYQAGLFESNTIERLCRNLQLFAQKLVEDATTPVASLQFAL